jgi:hypothetical protein
LKTRKRSTTNWSGAAELERFDFTFATKRSRRRTPWSKVRWDDDPTVPPPEEFVVQRNGQVRQAGATQADGVFIQQFRERAERDLYVFGKSVLNRRYFTPTLHLPICRWLQERQPDPNRKMLRCFREMGKTSIISHAVPLHIHIQSKERNTYFPGEEGCEQRILLVKETIEEAMREVRVVKEESENNQLMRALWPHRFWDDPRKQADRWSPAALIHPRKGNWPDESLRAMGVGGAIAGKHPSAIIKDDPISFNAANSPAEMETAIAWHLSSRALINRKGCLEFILGTPWAIHDLYSYIESTDKRENGGTVSIYDQPLVVDGVCVYPEFTVDTGDGVMVTYGFSQEKMDHIRQEDLQKWLLQYQITTIDSSMVDFALENVRFYQIINGELHFNEDARDAMLGDMERIQRPLSPTDKPIAKIWDLMDYKERRNEVLRSRVLA